MNRTVFALPLLALASCNKSSSADNAPSRDTNAIAVDESGPGGIAITAAPGVAFTYRYAFSLPPARIAAAQEMHAQACEKLGVARCRIVGMRYRLIGENHIEAMLAFKLDPAIARAFGKDGVAAIEAAEGRLTEAAISGTDAGAAITQADAAHIRAEEEQRRIDAQLAKAGSSGERSELQSQRAEAGRAAGSAAAVAAEQRQGLANTPMEFDYTSGAAIRGFDASAPVKSSLDTLFGSAQTTFAIVLGAIALLGPPGLVVLLVWFAIRAFRRRWPRTGRIGTSPTD